MKYIKNSYETSLVIFVTIIFSYSAVHAEEYPDFGLTGYLMLGTVYSRGNLAIDDTFDEANQTISSLDQSPKRSSEVSFLLDGGYSIFSKLER